MIINISIDDVSPNPLSSLKILDVCNRFRTYHADAKFTFFVPVAYWRTCPQPANAVSDRPYYLRENREFCDVIKNLDLDIFEVCYHGYNHGIRGRSNNDEFKSLNYDEALTLIDLMLEDVLNAGLGDIFKPVFRPPAWRISNDAIKALFDRNFKVLTLNRSSDYLSSYGDISKFMDKIIFMDSAPPFYKLVNKDRSSVVYHACEWDKNYFSDNMINEFIYFSSEIDDLKFCFIEELLSGKI